MFIMLLRSMLLVGVGTFCVLGRESYHRGATDWCVGLMVTALVFAIAREFLDYVKGIV